MHLISLLRQVHQRLGWLPRSHEDLLCLVLHYVAVVWKTVPTRVKQIECAAVRRLDAKQQILMISAARIVPFLTSVLIQLYVLQVFVGNLRVLQVAWVLLQLLLLLT